jgi:hypothetical protein
LLADGCVAWVFPSLTDPAEVAAVIDELQAVDRQLDHLGRLLELQPADGRWEGQLNRLMYDRLGPLPRLPKTELISEGWSDELYVLVRLWVPEARAATAAAGPRWTSGVWIELPCDVDPDTCGGHLIDQRVGAAVGSPRRAVQDLRAAVDWAFALLTTQSPQALRAHDSRRGHTVPPRPRD